MSELAIRPLGEPEAAAVTELLAADPPGYREHFEGLPLETEAVEAMLRAARRDRFWGIHFRDALVAVVMLRGLDAGYAAPAFGVYVGERWARHGLATLALSFAQTWCRLNGLDELMLTVHADNDAARRIYESDGFSFSGELSPLGHRIYRKRIAAG